MKIGIIGAGFVGTACEVGFSGMPRTQVLVYDKYKPTDSLQTVVSSSDILFVCLPTPMLEDGSCDTSIVASGCSQIAKVAGRKSKTIVIKSTVPPGTTQTLQEAFPTHNFFFNPEFLTEKNFISDFLNQSYIVLGATEKSRPHKEKLQKFYNEFQQYQNVESKQVWTDSKTAEMFKYTCNCFLATKVSFFNEMYQICDAVGVDYNELRSILDYDERIGKTHTQVPGPDGKFGFGGSCFPKDLNALMALAYENDVDPLMLGAAWAKNIVRDGAEWENLPQVTGKYAKA